MNVLDCSAVEGVCLCNDACQLGIICGKLLTLVTLFELFVHTNAIMVDVKKWHCVVNTLIRFINFAVVSEITAERSITSSVSFLINLF